MNREEIHARAAADPQGCWLSPEGNELHLVKTRKWLLVARREDGGSGKFWTNHDDDVQFMVERMFAGDSNLTFTLVNMLDPMEVDSTTPQYKDGTWSPGWGKR